MESDIFYELTYHFYINYLFNTYKLRMRILNKYNNMIYPLIS